LKIEVFDDGVLRRVFGPETNETRRLGRITFEKGFYNLYFSPKEDEMARACSTHRNDEKYMHLCRKI
jgi:hypothetical protein